jgi:hypothetical protein
MQYMCLIYSAEGQGPQPGTQAFSDYLAAYQAFTQSCVEGGVMKAGDALQPTSTATTVTREHGKLEITDGPFAETKEQLGGYYLLDCKDLDEALDYASRIPTAEHGRVEVRPVVVWDN